MKKINNFSKKSDNHSQQHSRAQQRNNIRWKQVFYRQEETQQAQLNIEMSQTSFFINFLPALCSPNTAVRIAAFTMLAGLCGMGFLNLISVFPPNKNIRLQAENSDTDIVLVNSASFFSQQLASRDRHTENPSPQSPSYFFQGVAAAEFSEEEEQRQRKRFYSHILETIHEITKNLNKKRPLEDIKLIRDDMTRLLSEIEIVFKELTPLSSCQENDCEKIWRKPGTPYASFLSWIDDTFEKTRNVNEAKTSHIKQCFEPFRQADVANTKQTFIDYTQDLETLKETIQARINSLNNAEKWILARTVNIENLKNKIENHEFDSDLFFLYEQLVSEDSRVEKFKERDEEYARTISRFCTERKCPDVNRIEPLFQGAAYRLTNHLVKCLQRDLPNYIPYQKSRPDFQA